MRTNSQESRNTWVEHGSKYFRIRSETMHYGAQQGRRTNTMNLQAHPSLHSVMAQQSLELATSHERRRGPARTHQLTAKKSIA